MTMPAMRTLFITLALVGFGCGSSNSKTPDAAPQIDAPAAVKQDCPTYCAEIQANCTGANAQYPSETQCEATCKSFALGTANDKGPNQNTLGCRIYHAGTPSMTAPGTHCAHAGPAGDVVTAAVGAGTCGDACTSFCKLEIATCGSSDAPIAGITPVAPAVPYQNVADCMTKCAGFATTTPYSTAATSGNTLACRLFHLTNAANYAAMNMNTTAQAHCGHSLATPTAVCL
jgi:hypothetical protein